MLELLICSMLTILPDYLIRRYAQGKRFGHEITLFSVWFELRIGIVACLMLTVTLITVIFYHHPTSRDVSFLFRTVPILPEAGGRVAEVHVSISDAVRPGDPIISLDASAERAALETAERRIVEINAAMRLAEADIAAAEGALRQAVGARAQAQDELDTRRALQARNADVVSPRDIERLENVVESRAGAVDAAQSALDAATERLSILLPAQKRSAEAQRDEAQVALDKMMVVAGVAGRVEQFTIRVGDFVSPLMRPAGVLIPDDAGGDALVAGFGQIEAQVMKVGMPAEVICASLPFTIIPMVVTDVQAVIAGGQVRAQDQLLDTATIAQDGTLTAILEPLHEGALDEVPRGSSCVANAYTRNHGTPEAANATGLHAAWLHVVDTVAVVHAILLRIEALIFPVQTLVLGGH